MNLTNKLPWLGLFPRVGLATAFIMAAAPLSNAAFDNENEGIENPIMTVMEDDNDAVEVRPFMGIHWTTDSINVNGIRDAAYLRHATLAGGTPIHLARDDVSGPDDLSANMYGVWNNQGVYLFFDVTDDVFDDSNANAWHSDSIEIYIDPFDNRNGGFDGISDFKLVVEPKADGTTVINVATAAPTPAPAGVDFSGLNAASIIGNNGWTAEVFIPWSVFQIEPARDLSMGLGIQINDNDGGLNTADGRIYWKSGPITDSLNTHTHQFGELRIWAPKTTQIGRTTTAPTINGTRDGVYAENSWQNITDRRWVRIQEESAPNTEVSWWGIHDDENLYLFFDIKDETLIFDEFDSAWHNDSLELVFDGNNSKGGTFDGVNDVKITFMPTDTEGGLRIFAIQGEQFPPPPPGTDFSGMEAAFVVTEDGWALEAKIPFSIFKFNPVPGAAFGIDFNLNDNNVGPPNSNRSILGWSTTAGVNERTDLYGTAFIFAPLEGTFAEATGTITVDGNVDENYGEALWHSIERTQTGQILAPKNHISAHWLGAYDQDAVYLVVDVIDRDHSIGDTQNHHDDGVEFFFDPSNNSSGNFDGVEDVKITVLPQPDGEVLLVTAGFPSPPANTDFSGVEAAWTPTTLGWRVELRVPFHTLRIDPVPGWELGFDIQINDDDFGGNRDHYLRWSGIRPANTNTHHYGTVTLAGEAVSLPDPELFSIVSGATAMDHDNFFESPVGIFYENPADHENWIYHIGLGWTYTGAAEAEENWWWLFSASLDAWVATNSSAYPVISVDGSHWAYLDVYGNRIYNYSSETWTAID